MWFVHGRSLLPIAAARLLSRRGNHAAASLRVEVAAFLFAWVLMARHEWSRLYKTAAWRRLREYQLSRQPLCEFCLRTEDVTEATIVDHIKAHKGDLELFHDPSNLQSLCKHHHDSAKQMIDLGKKVVTYGIDGYPIELG